jgi:hypothetical protein
VNVIAAAWQTTDTAFAITVALLLILSGFFALAETSLVRMTRTRAKSLADEGHRGGPALVELTSAPEKFLNPLLLLILICQLVSATLIGILAERLFGGAGIAVATVFEVVVIFVVFEAIPKNYAVHYADKSAVFSAPMVKFVLALWPIRWISKLLLGIAGAALKPLGVSDTSQRVTESEIIAMASVAVTDKAIDEQERDFIHSVIEFGDTVAREIMTPRTDMVTVEATATIYEAYAIMLREGRSRVPVVEGGPDDVVGVVTLRQLAMDVDEGRREDAVRGVIRDVNFVPETKPVGDLLKEFQRSHTHLVVVVDEYGGTSGIITLEDVLEELVGEIDDELTTTRDETETVARDRADRHPDEPFVVSGRLNVDDVDDDYGVDLPKGGWDTIGGLVLDIAGGVPHEGDVLTGDHYVFRVLRVDGRRIEEVEITPRRKDAE